MSEIQLTVVDEQQLPDTRFLFTLQYGDWKFSLVVRDYFTGDPPIFSIMDGVYSPTPTSKESK